MNGRGRAILILGMHRSGTSALTRVLGLCGAALPRHVIEASPEVNAKGFWEPKEIVALHDEILASARRSWHDLRDMPAAWFDSAEAAAFQSRLRALLLDDYGSAPLIAVKDPRLCRLLPLWRPVLAGLRIAPLIVVPVRNPLEIAASIGAREGYAEGKSLLLWLLHFLAAEHHSRDLPRCFVSYTGLLADWPGTVRRIGAALSIEWPGPIQPDEIDRFLAPSLRHHRADDEALFARDDIPRQITTAYRWALRAAAGAVPSPIELDAIREEIARAEPVFSLAVEAIEDYAQRRSDDLRHWVQVADERYAMIEQLQSTVAALQAQLNAQSAPPPVERGT